MNRHQQPFIQPLTWEPGRWVIEVLSPSTAAKDQIQKLAAYEHAGVREVWLVHPTDRVVVIYTVDADRRYGKPVIHETQGILAPGLFPDLMIEWALVFPDSTAT